MRTAVAFVGPELAASGWRLAGIDTVVAVPGGEAQALEQARGRAWLVLVCASVVERLDPAAWQRAATATQPLLVAVPDLQGRAPLPDLAARLRAQLGLAA